MSDLAWLAASFSDVLRGAGVPVTAERSGRFAQAISLLNPVTVTDLYWAARVTLVTDRGDLQAFDRVFDQVFGGTSELASRGDQSAPVLPRRRSEETPANPQGRRSTAPSKPDVGISAISFGSRAGKDAFEDSHESDVRLAAASHEERLAATDFADLDAEELSELYQLMRRLRLSPPMRRGRRLRRHRQGDRLDVRATLRRSHRTAGDPVVQIRRGRVPRRRRLVVLCDISGSMEPYARAYLRFLHAAAGASGAEVFAFATRLTRLTASMKSPSPQIALARAAEVTPDWRSGTRLGETLKAFIDGYGRRGLARSAVVVIVSDGWEGTDPDLLGEQMGRLSRLAFRIVWVNPRSADERFAPLAAGMAAALPFCDVLVSGHSMEALDGVIAAIARS